MPTSARWEAATSPKIFVKMVHSVGTMWASAPYKQVGSCGTNSHWAFASCNCLLRTSQSASLTAPLSGEPGALPRQVHAREKLQLHQPSAAVGADGVVHVVQIAAVGAGDLLDTARFRRFGIAEQIKFELFAALTAFDVHIQRTR